MVSICHIRVHIGQEEEISTGASYFPKCLPPFFFPHFQPLTSLELWQMVKQHYGNELGLSHEEMESLQVATEPSTQTRYVYYHIQTEPCTQLSCKLNLIPSVYLQPDHEARW